MKLRTACNKIIHADNIEILDWSNPVLQLQGKQGRKEWTAFVEVIDYIRASVENMEDATS